MPSVSAKKRAFWLSPAFVVLSAVSLFSVLILKLAPEWIQSILVTLVIGQITTLAVWAVIGPESPLTRWLFCLLGAAIVFFAIIANDVLWLDFYLVMVALFPAVFLAIQLPVWLLRLATGCRLVRRREGEPLPPRTRQFRLRDLLIATVILAVTLGVAQLGLGKKWGQEPNVLLALAIVCGTVMLWSGFIAPASIYAASVARNRVAGAFFLVFYILVGTSLYTAVFSALPGASPEELLGTQLPIRLCVNGGAALTVFATLATARSCRYVLLWPRRNQSPDSPAESDPDETTEESPFQSDE